VPITAEQNGEIWQGAGSVASRPGNGLAAQTTVANRDPPQSLALEIGRTESALSLASVTIC